MAEQELIVPAPEWLEVANSYLITRSAQATAEHLAVPLHTVIECLARKDVRDYLNQIYLDTGYRNRDRLGQVLDKMIDAKLEEAEETGIYTSKDLLEIIALVHKMRMEELKNAPVEIKQQTNVQINDASGTNYSKLMETLLASK
jgi:hypothetical protein